MPELPEIYTIVKDLKKYIPGAYIENVWIEPQYKKIEKHEIFKNKLEGKTIIGAERIAKNIILNLNDNNSLLFHLAMTGKLLLRSKEYKMDPYTKVKLDLQLNNKEVQLRFADMRMFGNVKILEEEQKKQLKNKYGPEPIDQNITPQIFHEAIKSKKTNIKNALLDQKVISGLGNVYATDALFISKIHPQTHTTEITLANAENLLEACKEILQEGIKNRGISMSDYVDLLGKKGNQQNHFKVYQKEVCIECGNKVEFIKLSGRGTYFCTSCQNKGSQINIL